MGPGAALLRLKARATVPPCAGHTNPAAIRQIARAMRDSVGNMQPLPGVYPDYAAPIVRSAADGVRELAAARWACRCPPSP